MAPPVASNGQPSPKPSMTNRSLGRQEEETSRRPPASRAWGSGINPITQKYGSATQSNGSASRAHAKPGLPEAANKGGRLSTDSHSIILSQALGQPCTIVTKEGDIFVGTPAAVKEKQADTLLLCRLVRQGSQADVGSPQASASKEYHIGYGPESIKVFPLSSLSSVAPSRLSKASRSGGKGFMTDTQISGNAAFRERKLERWQAPSDNALPLDNTNTSRDWDQFKVNQEKFGVKSDYDESHYTTVIDKGNPLYAMRERRAARIAAEIEGDARSNAFSESRGANDEGYDEEDLYSGVRRDLPSLATGQPNRYVPPIRRGQQQSSASKSTAKDAPKERINSPASDAFVDPAIISAQVARGEPTKDSKIATPHKPPSTGDGARTQETAGRDSQKTSFPTSGAGTAAPGASSARQQTVGTPSRVLPDVRTAFKNFANMEKLKVQDNRRRQASRDKAVKVNDLKKFAQNFKLNTPVPKDLLPILAKSETKQNEIVKKAQEQVDINKQVKQHPQQRASQNNTPGQQNSKQNASSVTPGQANGTAQATVTSPTVGLSERLKDTRRQHKNNQVQMAQNTTSPEAVQKASVPAQTSAAAEAAAAASERKKLSVAAPAFVPNAMAQPFRPGVTGVSSPGTKPASTRPITPSMPVPKFLREAKARDAKGVDPKPITAPIDQAKTMKPEEDDQTEKSATSAEAAKIPTKHAEPFRERVDWLDKSQTGKEHELPSYKDAFAGKLRGGRNMSLPASPGNMGRVPQPGHYQMANGMHGMHPMGPPQMHQHMPPPPHYPPTGPYEDPHMRPAHSMQPYSGPSPRMTNAYPSMPHGPMPYQQNGYMGPGGHAMGPRQFSNGPSGMAGPQMQPPMMVPPGATGPYMPQPMMAVQHGPPYQVGQPMYNGPPQPNGYPSPGRAPPMMPSNSHQGNSHSPYTPNNQYVNPAYQHHPPHHPGQMAPRGSFNGQPNYPQSPYQQHPYPARTPSHGYVQPHQTPTTPSSAPPAQPVGKAGSDAK